MRTRGVTREWINPDKSVAAWWMRRQPTRAEALQWERLRANRLGGLHFRRQQVIGGFIADFYCSAAGLAVEVDGSIHVETRETDAYRDAVLAERDIITLRITNDEILTSIANALDRILATAHARIAHEATHSAEAPISLPKRP